MRTVKLNEDAFAVVCGLVQESSAVDMDGIVTEPAVWSEIREAFPLAHFEQCVAEGKIEYEKGVF